MTDVRRGATLASVVQQPWVEPGTDSERSKPYRVSVGNHTKEAPC